MRSATTAEKGNLEQGAWTHTANKKDCRQATLRLKPKWKQLQQKLDYYFSSGRKKEPARVRLHKKISIHTNTNTYKHIQRDGLG